MATDSPEPGVLEALGDATWWLFRLEEEAALILTAVRGLAADTARTLIRQGWKDRCEIALLTEREAGALIRRLEAAQGMVQGAQTGYNNAVFSVEDLSVASLNEVTEAIGQSLPHVTATRVEIERLPG